MLLVIGHQNALPVVHHRNDSPLGIHVDFHLIQTGIVLLVIRRVHHDLVEKLVKHWE